VRRGGHGLRGIDDGRPKVGEGLGLVPAPVVDGGLVPGLDQVLTHPPAHDTGADPADPRLSGLRLRQTHDAPLVRRPVRGYHFPFTACTRIVHARTTDEYGRP